ncbi:MAG: antibiotic biosynthesis monooxygenase [Candidatus Eremiobacteraeota bacterium]|nr:antibiotic biosynthesis monooxygenase [Candidatus Eremiobacteraeota bacterium]
MITSNSEVTEVITTEVKPGCEDQYRQWAERVQKAQNQFPGYKGSFVQPPRAGERSWTTLMRFETVAQLEAWMNSPQRAALLLERQDLIEAEMLHRVDNSFPGWIPNDPTTGKPPSMWKTASLVLLTLYPVVMLELKFLSPILHAQHLPPAIATFIGNLISVLLTTWPLMPLAIRAFRPWIFPAANQPAYVAIVAPLAIAACYAIEIALFWNILN